jgi:hypothetical protein
LPEGKPALTILEKKKPAKARKIELPREAEEAENK